MSYGELALLGCCGCNGREYATHMNREHERRTEALNKEFIILGSAAMLSFVLVLLGILGMCDLLAIATGGAVLLFILGGTGLFASMIGGCLHYCRRASNSEPVNLLRDTFSFFGGERTTF